MNVFEIILLSFGLAADAFATSICKGLELPRVTFKHMIIVGLFFWYISRFNAFDWIFYRR